MEVEKETIYHFASDSNLIDLSCENCGFIKKIKQYRNMDLSHHREWKETLLNGDFFFSHCPNCGYLMDFSYPCRYFDPEKKLSIVLVPELCSDGSEEIISAMNERLFQLSMPGYLHRAVGSFYAMQELVKIRESNLDDRVIQLLKPMNIGKLQSMGKEVWNSFFDGIEQEPIEESLKDSILYIKIPNETISEDPDPILWFQIHLTNKKVERHGVNLSAYLLCEQMLAQNTVQEEDNGFSIYDLSWAIHFMNRLHFQEEENQIQ